YFARLYLSVCVYMSSTGPGVLLFFFFRREGGQRDVLVTWGRRSVLPVFHHVPDSHLNAYTRFKLACTEDSPTIKTYEEARWAELPEARTAPIDVSLDLLTALHRRWVLFLRLLGPDDFARTVRHPEWGSPTVDFLLAPSPWHGRHHTAHITALRDRMGWK